MRHTSEKQYRVKCQECKKQTTAKNGVCDSCGQYPGMISSYRDCPHNPVHAWNERGDCLRQIVKARKGKRVKHVVSSGQVPHLWYHKAQDSARTSTGNLYFEGATIFSYGSHFPIAKHVSNGKRSAVLFTTRSYSVTTSGHCSAVRSAIPSSALVFHIPELTYIGDDWKNSEKNSHAQNIKNYLARIEKSLVTSARARSSWSKEYSHKGALSTLAELKAYGQFFKVKLPKLPTVPRLDSKQMQAIRERESKTAARKAEETRLAKIEQAKRETEKIERWRAGENVGSLYNVPVMLRLRTFGADESVQHAVAMVETSRGAQVPVSHALRGLRFVRAVVTRGEAFQTNGHTFHLGHYKIDRIDVDGTLTAGCHVISLAEIERIAPELERIASAEDASPIAYA